MTPQDSIAVINAGSSSIKFSLFTCTGPGAADLTMAASARLENLNSGISRFVARDGDGRSIGEHSWDGAPLGHQNGMRYLLDFVGEHLGDYPLRAVGHRLVHGGADYSAPQRLDAAVLAQIERLIPLAPLHLPHNLAAVHAIAALAPALPQVGCFDTAFHTAQPAIAQAYALPQALSDQGIRRYGFHGLSYEYIATALPGVAPDLARGRVVAAHLGNGASMCAMAGGRSLASTMGFTAVDGLPMGTRCGSLDPGVVLYLIQQLGMEPAAVQRLLYEQSGLLGVSGLSSDMRALEQSDDPRARLAIELMVYRIGRELGSLAAALGGLDALVFSGGIGENSATLRAAVCRDAAWLGVVLDAEANADIASGLRCLSSAASRVQVWVVPANEEWMIARHTRALLEAV